MDFDGLPTLGDSISQLELSVDRSFKSGTSSSREDVVSAEARLYVILQGMHRYLNTFSPIHRLPPEMLSRIFEEVVASCVKPVTVDRVDVRPQFRLAHVCQFWRSVALGDASLWSCIDVGYPEAAVKFFLRCSSGYPLTVYASVEKASLVDNIFKDHGTRIRTVYVSSIKEGAAIARTSYYPHGHFYAAQGVLLPPFHRRFNNPSGNNRDVKEPLGPVFQHLCSSAPQLECLVLQEFGSGLMRSFESWYPPLSKSPLKALALILSDAYFPTNPFPNLTHLCLSFPLPRYNVQEFTKSLSQLLSNAPRLQFLQLSNLRTNSISVEDFTRRLPKVSLGQLRLLEFSDVQLQMVFYLLRHLTIPETVLLSVEEDGRRTGVRSNDHPLLLRLPHIAPLRNAATSMEILAEPRALLLTGYGSTRASGFLLKARNINGINWSTEWLPELHDMMSLSHITVLHINDNGGQVLPSLLPYFTQLEELSILCQWHSTAHGRAGMIETVPEVLVSLTPLTTLVCPVLRFLGLEVDADPKSFPYAELYTMAVWRYKWGCAIHRFVYQWHGSTILRPAAGSSTEAELEERDVLMQVEESLTPLLEPYVDSIEYRLSSAEKLCPFHPPGSWRVPGGEKYWSTSTPSYVDIRSSSEQIRDSARRGSAQWNAARRQRMVGVGLPRPQ